MSILDLKNYQKTPVSNGETIVPDWGNKIDRGVFAAIHQGGDTYLDGVTTELIRDTAGLLIRVEESVGSLLFRKTELARVAGELSTVTVTVYGYDEDGLSQAVIAQWTDTLSRTGGQLTSVERVVLV